MAETDDITFGHSVQFWHTIKSLRVRLCLCLRSELESQIIQYMLHTHTQAHTHARTLGILCLSRCVQKGKRFRNAVVETLRSMRVSFGRKSK